MFDSILIVCTGNICRSPIAERMLRQILPDKKIDSAGIAALVDKPADPTAVVIAQKHQLRLDNHHATQFTSSLGRQYDLILVMEKSHQAQISRSSPEVRGKVMLLGHWMEGREIPDPYRKSQEAFESVYRLIDQACHSWLQKLNG
ncbi:protein tyrosine phosphatase [Rahnella victoriana]|uniref:protein-tyrosine-phosphatase n=1 Tax=Rahnella victoriana TaxID=1510570 RepID=A0ABS0DKK6_9GAMM|nr:protein tyrosine phosphatase [Rahnella victoriana]MBF7954425.1 protein tyrosine phosphatase [Rahnella victoriana]